MGPWKPRETRSEQADRFSQRLHGFCGKVLQDDTATDRKRSGQIGQKGVGALLRQLPEDADRFLGLLQRLLAASEVAEPVGQIVQPKNGSQAGASASRPGLPMTLPPRN